MDSREKIWIPKKYIITGELPVTIAGKNTGNDYR